MIRPRKAGLAKILGAFVMPSGNGELDFGIMPRDKAFGPVKRVGVPLDKMRHGPVVIGKAPVIARRGQIYYDFLAGKECREIVAGGEIVGGYVNRRESGKVKSGIDAVFHDLTP